MVSANIDISEEPRLQGLFTKSTVKVVGGENIGIVGYTTKNTAVISKPGMKRHSSIRSNGNGSVQKMVAENLNPEAVLYHFLSFLSVIQKCLCDPLLISNHGCGFKNIMHSHVTETV